MENIRVLELYDLYSENVYKLAFSYMSNKSDAEDIVQNVFLKLLHQNYHIHEGQEKSYILSMTANACKDLIRSRKKMSDVNYEDLPDNRTTQDYIKCFQLANDESWYVLMFSEDHELYSESQLQHMAENNITPTEEELHSKYWVFWYVSEDSDVYYMLSLAENKFSLEEAESIAAGISSMP